MPDDHRIADPFIFPVWRGTGVNHPVHVPDTAVLPYDGFGLDLAGFKALTIHLYMDLLHPRLLDLSTFFNFSIFYRKQFAYDSYYMDEVWESKCATKR